MAQSDTSIKKAAPSERSEEARLLLKQADAFVKEHDYEAALVAVERAKEIDARNPYVNAYEYRVRTLIGGLREREKEKAAESGKPTVDDHVRAAREAIAVGDLERGAHAIEQAEALSQDDPAIEAVRIDLRDARQMIQVQAAITSEITKHLEAAESSVGVGDRMKALEEATEAFILDPVHGALSEFESRHQTWLEEYVRTAEASLAA